MCRSFGPRSEERVVMELTSVYRNLYSADALPMT
jgi:hypothetical protein